MYRGLSTLLITILILGCSSTLANKTNTLAGLKLEPLQQRQRIVRFLNEPHRASVTIYSTRDNKKNPEHLGSGILLRRIKGHKIIVLTAAHVVSKINPKYIRLVGTNNSWAQNGITIIKSSQPKDLALLSTTELARRSGAVAHLAKWEPALGEEVYAIGAPARSADSISRGIISRFNSNSYRVDIGMFFGSSGGGLYDTRGKLVGVARAMGVNTSLCRGIFQPIQQIVTPIPGSGYFVRLKSIHQFLSTQ